MNNMKIKNMWSYVIVLGILQVIIEYIFYRKVDSNEFSWHTLFFFDLLSGFLSILLFSILGVTLFSLIPFKQLSFSTKFKTLFPIIVLILMGVSILLSIYLKYLKHIRGIELSPTK